MSFEQSNQEAGNWQQGWSYKGEYFRISMDLQRALIERRYGFTSDEYATKWIEEFSTLFRDFIESHPELVQEYKTNPESALSKIEEGIYVRHEA